MYTQPSYLLYNGHVFSVLDTVLSNFLMLQNVFSFSCLSTIACPLFWLRQLHFLSVDWFQTMYYSRVTPSKDRAICKHFFASVSVLHQCFSIVSTFARPCSCQNIRKSIPAYSLGLYAEYNCIWCVPVIP